MPIHTINGTTVFLHPVQNIILISTNKDEMASSEVEAIVKTIAKNKGKFEIQDAGLNYDVLVRTNTSLYSHQYDENGVPSIESNSRKIDENGLFHFKFFSSDTWDGESFTLDSRERMTIEKADANNENVVNEILLFMKDHYPSHFEDWELDPNSANPEVMEHVKLLISSSTDFYVVRNESQEIVAVNGFSLTADKSLGFQTVTVTHSDMRGQGIMLALLQRAINDNPDALLTSYFIDQKIRDHLGASAMTHTGKNDLPISNGFLSDRMEQKNLRLTAEHGYRAM